jgi:hypothetical protein
MNNKIHKIHYFIYPIFLPCRLNVSVPDIFCCETFGLDVRRVVDIRRTDVFPKCSARLKKKKKKLVKFCF